MGRETVLFKSEERKSAAEAAAVLRTIADRIESGQITLTGQGGEVSLVIPPQVTLEIKAEEEEGRTLKRSLEIELEWAEGDTGPDTGVKIG
ncbi:amphi-Trp domain-containing protein [Pseudodesulfovibrio sp. F-1]|uniref:Amphi-Trp domain-containing protein n=1 Tax=Pseudodesulfovibrio alkaliphilus TaxID=2661613 RepID=A0A7K1KP56_9BACT|nr:amphi-Trp domain-containing protein [Pseudodesulfovibrio alkaliphilus]MUM77869.1 amphi-Trp domain-containing protein [Pseudodesulfovibrio alkaliphilus]